MPTHPVVAALPGAEPFAENLLTEFAEVLQAKLSLGYEPRTHHLNADGSPRYSNRLLLETSPYLLQHAHNPVNWYPWGNQAFADAKRLNRLVLLSVGYSTCHWCHVMERESFEDAEIARQMNQNYIAIKVDREVRPDIDAIYMTAVQLLTQRGGWPMTVWLTADGQPIYGGTYFPPRDGDRGAQYGFATLLASLAEKYRQDPGEVAQYGEELAHAVQTAMSSPAAAGSLPEAAVLGTAARYYQERFDEFDGGMQGAPKFPSNLPARLLLRYYHRSNDRSFLDMVALSLRKMAAGGLFDQVGGGFHRYSVDPHWLVPHFEKMLYDNAQLVLDFVETYQLTGDEHFAGVARQTLDYVGREMTAAGKGFYSATDADSLNPEGHYEEGWFFTWEPAEIDSVLTEEQARAVKAFYGVTEQGNFEGRNILHRDADSAEVANQLDLSEQQLEELLQQSRAELYRHRATRPPPLLDDKVLTAWNGLMISAFAVAGQVLDHAEYSERAAAAADFVLQNMRDGERLRRSYKDGAARHNAYLDDYAFFIAALLDVYEGSGAIRWLEQALALQAVMDSHYLDSAGGYFFTSDDHEALLVRQKPVFDGAEPSGNSVALMNLLRLAEFTTEHRYREQAEKLLTALGERLTKAPANHAALLLGLDYYHSEPREIVLVTPNNRAEAKPFLDVLRRTFSPHKILVVAVEGEDLDRQARHIPLLEGKVARDGKTTAYVCKAGLCKLPVTDVATFVEQLKGEG